MKFTILLATITMLGCIAAAPYGDENQRDAEATYFFNELGEQTGGPSHNDMDADFMIPLTDRVDQDLLKFNQHKEQLTDPVFKVNYPLSVMKISDQNMQDSRAAKGLMQQKKAFAMTPALKSQFDGELRTCKRVILIISDSINTRQSARSTKWDKASGMSQDVERNGDLMDYQATQWGPFVEMVTQANPDVLQILFPSGNLANAENQDLVLSYAEAHQAIAANDMVELGKTVHFIRNELSKPAPPLPTDSKKTFIGHLAANQRIAPTERIMTAILKSFGQVSIDVKRARGAKTKTKIIVSFNQDMGDFDLTRPDNLKQFEYLFWHLQGLQEDTQSEYTGEFYPANDGLFPNNEFIVHINTPTAVDEQHDPVRAIDIFKNVDILRFMESEIHHIAETQEVAEKKKGLSAAFSKFSLKSSKSKVATKLDMAAYTLTFHHARMILSRIFDKINDPEKLEAEDVARIAAYMGSPPSRAVTTLMCEPDILRVARRFPPNYNFIYSPDDTSSMRSGLTGRSNSVRSPGQHARSQYEHIPGQQSLADPTSASSVVSAPSYAAAPPTSANSMFPVSSPPSAAAPVDLMKALSVFTQEQRDAIDADVMSDMIMRASIGQHNPNGFLLTNPAVVQMLGPAQVAVMSRGAPNPFL